MKPKFIALICCLTILLMVLPGFTQELDELIVAPEVLFNGATPDGVFFKPGRILDDNTIWFSGNISGLFAQEVYVWRSIDDGATFTHNETAIPGRAAQMDAFDADVAIVATAEGFIYRTTDGGATWTEVYSYVISATVDGWFDGCRVINENVAVAYGDFEPDGNMHFVRTTDKGATWTEIEGIDYLGAAYAYYTWGTAACTVGESIWCSATNTSYDSSFVFRSYDAGATWNSFKISADVIPNYPRSIAFVDDNNGLIAARGGYLIKSMDGGATWSATNNPDTSANCYPNSVVAIPGTDIIVAMDDIGAYYTSDLGATWAKIGMPEETAADYIVSGEFLNTAMGYVFTDNGLVLRFKNQIPVNLDNLVVAPEVLFNGATPDGVFFKPGRILDDNTIWFSGNISGLFAQEVYVWRSIDDGATFTHNETAIPGRAAQMDAFDADVAIVATAEGFIYRTTDGGATWTEVYSYVISATVDGWFDGCRVINENVAVAYGDFEPDGNMHFVRTTDKGATWTEIEGIDYLGAAYAYYTWGTAACTVGESIWCSATNTSYDSSFVFRSYDAGATWNSFKISADVIPNYPRSIAFVDDNNGLIAARGGYLIKSMDGGATWSATNNPDTSANCYPNSVVAIPGTDIIVAMDDIGAYYTSDLGATWAKIGMPEETAADYIVSGEFLNTAMGYVFTDNGLVLRFENQVTGTSRPVTMNTPNDFQLHQNYPNPFNPTTQIVFSMPRAADVKIMIYDILGRKIRTVYEGFKGAGTHQVIWNGLNDADAQVSSGTYIYKLQTKDINLQRRMLLLR